MSKLWGRVTGQNRIDEAKKQELQYILSQIAVRKQAIEFGSLQKHDLEQAMVELDRYIAVNSGRQEIQSEIAQMKQWRQDINSCVMIAQKAETGRSGLPQRIGKENRMSQEIGQVREEYSRYYREEVKQRTMFLPDDIALKCQREIARERKQRGIEHAGIDK